MSELKPGANKTESLTKAAVEALDQLADPTISILSQLRRHVEKGEYQMIIGDDASGRVPALVVWHVLKEIYAKRGYTSPLMRFVAGGAGENAVTANALKERVERMEKDSSENRLSAGRALVVTDTISSGESLQHLLENLKERNWDFDIASVGILNGGTIMKMQRKYNCKIASGMKNEPAIYGEKGLSGVYKSRGEDVTAKASRGNWRGDDYDDDQRVINDARLYIQTHIVPKVIDAYEKHTWWF